MWISPSPNQVSFIDFIVFPLWETWAELVYPDAQSILQYLARTRDYWSGLVPTSPPPSEDGQKKYDELLEGKDGAKEEEADPPEATLSPVSVSVMGSDRR